MTVAHPRPVVGVSTYMVYAEWRDWRSDSVLTPQPYITHVVDAGGIPVLLPPQLHSAGAIDQVLEMVDAILLIGGEDVCGRWSNRSEDEAAHAKHHDQRDEFEVALTRRAIEEEVPVLGICRGLQILNVACGGTLIEDLPASGASGIHLTTRGTFNPHPVAYTEHFTPGLFDPDAAVPSHHHQAVDTVGSRLRVVGRAEDGVVEAVEGSTGSFVVGVQWHPEEDDDNRLFEALVAAAELRGN